MPRVLVCGAGVGGLSTAAALRRQGFDVTVYERHDELRTAGVGLNLWPNGARVLQTLGVSEQFEAISTRLRSFVTLTGSGEVSDDVDLESWPERFGAPMTGIYRQDLNAMVAGAVGEENIRFGHRLTGFEEDADGVRCTFANGETAYGDVLVGADGVYSTVRAQLFGETRFRDATFYRWRGLFRVADVDIDPTIQVEVIAERGHLGWLPIGKGRAYWYAAGDECEEREAFMEYFMSLTDTPVPSVIEASDADGIIRNELLDLVEPLQEWGSGRVTLMGDAAHPMLPGMAQGANQALEDAAAIARALASADDLVEGLRAYEAQRRPTANRVVELSRPLFDFEDEAAVTDAHQPNRIFKHYYEVVESVPA